MKGMTDVLHDIDNWITHENIDIICRDIESQIADGIMNNSYDIACQGNGEAMAYFVMNRLGKKYQLTYEVSSDRLCFMCGKGFKPGDKVVIRGRDPILGEVIKVNGDLDFPYGDAIYLVEFKEIEDGERHLLHGYFAPDRLTFVFTE